jgi:redox-sensitive bicupin YhaK (pirin superfamily)
MQREAIPAIRADEGRATVNLISGAWQGKEGPVHSLTGVFMATVEFLAGGRVSFDGLAGRDVFLYTVRGDLHVAGTAVQAFNLVELSEGAAIEVEAATQAVALFGHADPIDEPVVSHGPFVMYSTEEIRQAYADYRVGRLQIAG